MVDVMVKDEDASRINRIVERFKLTTTDTAKMDTVITKSIEDREAEKREKSIPEKSKEQQLEDLLAKKPMQTEETSKVNFNMAKTEKTLCQSLPQRLPKCKKGYLKEQRNHL